MLAAGLVGGSDPVKKFTPNAIRELRAAGLKIIMHGDSETTAKAAADKPGILGRRQTARSRWSRSAKRIVLGSLGRES